MKTIMPDIRNHAIVIIIFLIISFVYSYPTFEGKKLKQHDVVTYQGGTEEKRKFEEKTGETTLWTNSLFGGMPTYLISTPKSPNYIKPLNSLFNIFHNRPASHIFLYLLGFYICSFIFTSSIWISLIGAIAYGFSSYFFTIIEAGHISKVIAVGYMPPIIAGVYLAYNRKMLLGATIFGIFLSLQLLVNHMQISYYTLIIILVFIISQFIADLQTKQLKRFIITSLVLIVPGLLAVGSNATTIMTTLEYGKYSMRGKSELTPKDNNQTTGLDKDYAMGWSYGVDETLTLLIPNFKGGASALSLSNNSESYEFFKKIQGANYAKKVIKNMPTYWGPQPSTSGPVYVGAIVFFLFILGLFIIESKKIKYWLLSVTVLAIFLSWGRNFESFSNFFFDYIPGYNKFRSVSMTLVMASFAFPIVAILTLKKILEDGIDKKVLLKYMKYSMYFTGGILLIFIVFSAKIYDFSHENDEYYLKQGANQFIEALRADRKALLVRDCFRSLVFIGLAFSAIYLFIADKLSKIYTLTAIATLVLIDMWSVDKRYLNNDDFVPKKEARTPYVPNMADIEILKDTDPDFRVLDFSENTFNSARTSFFHKSIGGYHGAKMKRYQELIEYHISGEMNILAQGLRKIKTQQDIDSLLNGLNVLNMLNTKYFILNPQSGPLMNPRRLGNAWIVKDALVVKNADEEINALYEADLRNTAVIDKRYKNFLNKKQFEDSPNGLIQLTHYQPNKLIYQFSSDHDELAVFSEIFYDKGWKAYVDGNETPHFRADYVLRAMIIPSGKHEIEFRFEPETYYKGNKITFASSVLLLILLVGALGFELKGAFKKINNNA